MFIKSDYPKIFTMIILITTCFSANNISAQDLFTDIGAGLTGVKNSYVAWGDYDNDGDLDILLTGWDGTQGGGTFSRIYRNDSGVFSDIDAGLRGLGYSSAAWGDYDNDGDLDILLTGRDGIYYISRIYRNDSGVFIDIEAELIEVSDGSVAWGDYDNDGDLDFLITGYTGGYRISRIYRNDSGVFSNINAGLTAVSNSSVAWGDYDNDGDLDILLTGWDGTSGGGTFSKIYRNDPSTGSEREFIDINAGLTGYSRSSVAWGDYDNDGDLDILLAGNHSSCIIYRNDSGLFTDINAGLTSLEFTSAAWGDYDNDGDLDILLIGRDGIVDYFSRIYGNDAGKFTDIKAGLTGVHLGSAAWGDYDNDGDLDILLTGEDAKENPVSRIYRNNSEIRNTIPFLPKGLSVLLSADSLSFKWEKSSDNETPQQGLSYNLIIGNSEYDILMNPPMSATENGYRHTPAFGNTCQVNTWTYYFPEVYDYPHIIPPDYWGVQTIDHSFAGSAFAIESFDIPVEYLLLSSEEIMQAHDLLTWQVDYGESLINYQVQIDDDSTFNSCEIDDTLLVSLGGEYFYSIPLLGFEEVENLVEGTKYYWRIKPNYTFGLLTAFTEPAPHFWFGFIAGIEGEQETGIPKEFTLQQNYPNPFNPLTQIRYALPQRAHVKIELYDMIGRKINVLVDEQKPAGYHSFTFEADNLTSGIYLYRIQADNYVSTKKMLLLK